MAHETLLGIQIVYCDGSNKRQQVWVDIGTVQTITWGSQNPPPKPPTPPKGSIPKVPNAPGGCPAEDALTHHDLCWWDGHQWICGIE